MDNTTTRNSTHLTPVEWNAILTGGRIPLMFVTISLMLIGIIGNVLVILVYKLRLKQQEGRFFIPYLAISDLIAITVTCTFLSILDFTEALFPSDVLCRFFQFMNWSGVQNSILILFLVALHRYLLICHPLKPILDGRKKKMAVALLAIISILLSLPLTVFSSSVVLRVTYKGRQTWGTFCSFNQGKYPVGEKIYQGILFIGNIVILGVTTLLYIPIGRVVFLKSGSRDRKTHNETNTSGTSTTTLSVDEGSNATSGSGEAKMKPTQSNSARIRRNFTVTLMMVVTLYIVSYVPFYIIIFNGINDLDVWFNLRPLTLNGYLFLNRCYMLNNVVNPIIYSMFDVVFKRELKAMLKTCWANVLSIRKN